jgi:hypothetical protein
MEWCALVAPRQLHTQVSESIDTARSAVLLAVKGVKLILSFQRAFHQSCRRLRQRFGRLQQRVFRLHGH